MQLSCPRRLAVPVALASAGAGAAVLAAADKVFGLVQRPLHLATAAYAALFLLLAWVSVRGLPLRPARLVRLSVYGAVLGFHLLTAAYVFAWRVSVDPTPLVVQADLNRGDELLAEGDKTGAQLVYRRAYQRYPGSFTVLMRMGIVNYHLADYDRARRYFSRALEAAPSASRWQALNELGQTYWMLEEPREAIALYERAAREGLPPSARVEWHYRLAWAHFDARSYDEAIEHYLAVARAGEKYAAASYYNAACAQAQLLRLARDGAERRRLLGEAIDNLRRAWQGTRTDEERQSLRGGLLGGPSEQDPELEPLRGAPEFQRLLLDLRSH